MSEPQEEKEELLTEETPDTPEPEQPEASADSVDTPEEEITSEEEAASEEELTSEDTTMDEDASLEETDSSDGLMSEEAKKIERNAISGGAVFGAVVVVLLSVASIFLLGVNSLIARPVQLGNKALAEGDIRSCYSFYAESNEIAMRLNNMYAQGTGLTLFTNGTNTLVRQIVALDRLNGPFQAGQVTAQYFPLHTPRPLQDTYKIYSGISAFVERMQTEISDYQATLKDDEQPSYEKMIALVDKAEKALPATPDYMAEYYRFSISYSLHDDAKRTVKHLDTLRKLAPDALWLYASEGIRAYNDAGAYKKSLLLCNDLMAKDAANPASIAYTMQSLRLLKEFDSALAIYDHALELTSPSSEMDRQKSIILMLQGDTKTAQELLVNSFSPQTANLEHVATIAVCAWMNEDTETYDVYKSMLDSYLPFADVDAFVEGEKTLEDIFLKDGGEIQ